MIVLAACNPNRFVSGWVPYWGATQGRAAYTGGAGGMFRDVSPFFFSAQADGTIALIGSLSQLNTIVSTAHSYGITVLPTITDGSGPLTMATVILADPAARANHINNIVALALANGFDGIDLDYEGFAFTDGRATWPTTQPYWRAFVHELADALHANGKLLSVTIPPVWIAGGQQTGYDVYDQQFIATYADRVRLMVYDWSVSSPGPISPMSWLQQVIAYTNSLSIDRSKFQLGVPAYGRDWGRQANPAERCPDGAFTTKSVELENIPALVAARGASPVRHGSGEMYFTYDTVATGFSTTPITPPNYIPPATRVGTIADSANDSTGLQPALRLTPPDIQVSCTIRHFVYYPDATTIQQHAQAALDAGWSGIVLWALGYETADVYTMLADTTP